MMTALARFLSRLHRDESGASMIEKILILAAVALPILIIILVFGKNVVKWFKDSSEKVEPLE